MGELTGIQWCDKNLVVMETFQCELRPQASPNPENAVRQTDESGTYPYQTSTGSPARPSAPPAANIWDANRQGSVFHIFGPKPSTPTVEAAVDPLDLTALSLEHDLSDEFILDLDDEDLAPFLSPLTDMIDFMSPGVRQTQDHHASLLPDQVSCCDQSKELDDFLALPAEGNDNSRDEDSSRPSTPAAAEVVGRAAMMALFDTTPDNSQHNTPTPSATPSVQQTQSIVYPVSAPHTPQQQSNQHPPQQPNVCHLEAFDANRPIQTRPPDRPTQAPSSAVFHLPVMPSLPLISSGAPLMYLAPQSTTPPINPFSCSSASKPVKRSRSPSFTAKLAAPMTPQLYVEPVPTVPLPKPSPHLYKRSKAHNGKGTEQDYLCAHCGRRKTSSSACGDGRVRIRCECGGHRKDGRPRMHASWVPVNADEESVATPPHVVRRTIGQANPAANGSSWVFVDDTLTMLPFKSS